MSHFNADELALTKPQILAILDSLIKDWSGNPKENWQYILEAKAVKLIFGRVPAEKYPYFWRVFWERADALRYINTVNKEPTLEKLAQVSGNRFQIDLTKAIKK